MAISQVLQLQGKFILANYILVLYPHFVTSPFLPGGKKQPSWPVAFKCSNRSDAEAIAHVHMLIDEHIGFDVKRTLQARMIWTSKPIQHYSASSDLKGPYYPVVYTGFGGTESMIYRDWQ